MPTDKCKFVNFHDFLGCILRFCNTKDKFKISVNRTVIRALKTFIVCST